jgi:hypothetical protein
VFAIAFHFGPQLTQEASFELHNVPYFHAHDDWLSGRDRAIDKQHVVENRPDWEEQCWHAC